MLLHRRRSGHERLRRRPATLVVDTFSLALVMLALLYTGGLLSWPFLEPIRLVTFAALGLAPIAFLFALLDLRLARGDVAGLLVELQSEPTTDLQAPLARARCATRRCDCPTGYLSSAPGPTRTALRRRRRRRAPTGGSECCTGRASRWRR